jgi:capsular polysaccharide biosynthesis protein
VSDLLSSEWKVCVFPELPATEVVTETVRGAFLSRAESGAIHWTNPWPREYVRGAVYDGEGRLVPASQRLGGMNRDTVVTVNPPRLRRRERWAAHARRFRGRWLYAGNWMHGFGHFLVETLPTLWAIADRPEQVRGIAAHRFNSGKTHAWQFELVRLLTTAPVELIDGRPARVAELLVPTRPYQYQRAISPVATRVWDAMAERARAGAEPAAGTPLFLSRSRYDDRGAGRAATGREYHNRQAVDEVFADRGFQVVHPETLPVAEQIRLVWAAPVLAGQAGSALHLSAFARRGTRVLELGDTRTGAKIVGTQAAISAVKAQPTAHVPFVSDGEGGMDLAHLRRRLDALLAVPEIPL